MQTIIFDQTHEWLVEAHGNGVGYRLVHQRDWDLCRDYVYGE